MQLEILKNGMFSKVYEMDCFQKEFKNIKPNLYSIRYPKSKLNPRVLYIYLDEGEVLLLAAFKEKSKSDYARNIKLALNRLKILER